MQKPMKSNAPLCGQKRLGGMTRKGREIVASLTEARELEQAGIPIESRFTVRRWNCRMSR